MRFTPGDSWTWSYKSFDGDEYLGLFLTLDNGVRYFFRTNFKAEHLVVFPEAGQPFCVLDGQLLNDFMTGLDAIGVYDNSSEHEVSINMELALNAVACYRFVNAPKRAIEHAFLPYNRPDISIHRGMVASLYTKDRSVCDFIVLDNEDEAKDGIFRLMFANRSFHIGNRVLSVGALIKVPRKVICPFRSMSVHSTDINYA